MTFDVAFRHQQALDPSALTTIGSTLHAISKAMDDCRNAGVSAEEDPAVILLARHFAAVCDTRPGPVELQGRCMQAIKELRGAPVLMTLAHRGVDFDAPAKNAFHSEGQKAMRAGQGPAAGKRAVRGTVLPGRSRSLGRDHPPHGEVLRAAQPGPVRSR